MVEVRVKGSEEAITTTRLVVQILTEWGFSEPYAWEVLLKANVEAMKIAESHIRQPDERSEPGE